MDMKKEILKTDQSKGTNSNLISGFHIICAIAGAGVLALPYNMAMVGWISIVFLFVLASMAYYCGTLLIECLYYNPEKRLHILPDIGYEAFGIPGKLIVQFGHYMTCLSSVIIYLILTGNFMYDITGSLSNKIWILIAGGIVAVPYCLLKSVKEANILGFFGVLTTFGAILTAVIFSFIFGPSETYEPIDIIKAEKIPLVLAILSFAFGGSVIFPHIESAMRTPKSFNKTWGISLLIISVSYSIIGVVGMSIYGKSIKTNIIDHLNQVKVVFVVVALFITLHVLLAAPIYLGNVSVDLEKYLNITVEKLGKMKEFFIRISIRLIIIAVLTIIAYYIPYFNSVASLVGAICNGLIVFLVPSICHLKLYGFKNRKVWEYIVLTLTIVTGFICLGWGTYSCMIKLICELKNGENSSECNKV